MRFVSSMLVILISLTVLLSGQDTVHASPGPAGEGHHMVMIDSAQPMKFNSHGSHADICGMTVCGPYIEDHSATAMFMPVVTTVTYWVKDLPLESADADGSYKPPRA